MKAYSLKFLFIAIVYLLFSINIYSQATYLSTNFVEQNGDLRIEGTQVVNNNGDAIVLRGMSLFWSQWIGKYYNADCIQWLSTDWKCTVVRAALGIGKDGYLEHPEREYKKIKRVIDACIRQGIYVIVDWHSHNAENQQKEAVDFFSRVAIEYGSYPNIIYEIYNEPIHASWDSTLKPYAETVIQAIRQYDTNNIIIIGTPVWSQNVNEAADNPVIGINLAYTAHFYAGTHTQWLRDKIDYALQKGLAIWVTEFGICDSNGDGKIAITETEIWLEYLEKNKISYCNWSVSDKKETASILKPNASKKGGWMEKDISESGKFIRNYYRKF